MSNSNTDRDERVRHQSVGTQIVNNWHSGNYVDLIAAIDAALDSQAMNNTLPDDDELVAEMNTEAENLVGEWYRESQHRDELVDEIATTLTATHRRAEAHAATRMRDLCVQKVRELRDEWKKGLQYEEDFDWRVDTAIKIITALESLTLDQVEQEKSKPVDVCVVCKSEPVCPEDGFDTCTYCARRI